MTKYYISSDKELSPRPRSKRRNGGGGAGSSITVFQQAAGYFLSRLYRDIAEGHITFAQGLTALNSIILGAYEEGVKGGKISQEGAAELESLLVRAKAIIGNGVVHQDEEGDSIPALQVRGDSAYSGSLSSTDFISGFLGGKGWALKRNEFRNAAGETEYKYTLEVDNVTARGILRVYEMVASQMRGENDNVTFAARMKVHHYDAATGKVWLDTEGGQLMCVFKQDDCILVQRYQPAGDVASGGDGYATKSYELVIDEWGTGGATNEAGERLDWVTFRNFTTQMEGLTAADLITRGDTFTRVDSLSDPERKGIIQIMTVGENRPHIDIIHSLKTDPDNALKGRLGNLEGIRHHLFGWLKGFGEYLINAYIVGDMRLRRTGESLDTLIEAVNGLMSSRMSEVVYEMTDDDNFIRNAGFTVLDTDGSLKDWTVTDDDVSFYTVNGDPVVSSVGTLADVRSAVKTLEMDGKLVLHIINGSLTQSHGVMRSPGTHKVYDEGEGDTQTGTYTEKLDTLYLGIRMRVVRDGTLTIGFPGSSETDPAAIKAKTSLLERGDEWTTYQWQGVWDGSSDFVLRFTGECYVSHLSLTTDPLGSFKTEYATQILQTSRNISLVASKSSANASSIAELKIEAERISSTVTSNYSDLDGKIQTNSSLIEQTATAIRLEVQSVSDNLDGVATRVGTLEVHDTDITARVTSTETTITRHSSALDDIDTDLTGLHGDVTTITTRIGELTVADTGITARVSTVETTTAQHTTDISGLSDDVDGLSDSLATTNSNLVSVTARVGQLEVTDSNITARVSTVEATTAQHTTDISGLSDDVDGLSDSLATTNSNLASVTARVGQLEVTDSNITAQVTQLEQRTTSIAAVDEWEQGTTNDIPGYTYEQIKAPASSRIRTKGLFPSTDQLCVILSGNAESWFMVGFEYFTSEKKVCGTPWSGWKTMAADGTGNKRIEVNGPDDCAYIAVLLSYYDGRNIEPWQVKDTGITFISKQTATRAFVSVETESVRLGIEEGLEFVGIHIDGKNSTIKLTADKIDFLTNGWQVQNKVGETTLRLDKNGNLTVKGTINGGNIADNVSVGSGSNRMYIRPNESNGAELVGVASGNETLLLGFSEERMQVGGNYQSPVYADAIISKVQLKSFVNGSLKIRNAVSPGGMMISDGDGNVLARFNWTQTYAERIHAKYFGISRDDAFSYGVDGTFSAGSRTVTVRGGIITNIA